MTFLITDASELITCCADAHEVAGENVASLEVIGGGALAIEGDRIIDVGTSDDLRRRHRGAEELSAQGKLVSPGLVDPHTHLVYAGSRHVDYDLQLTARPGTPPVGGGIRTTVAATRAAASEALRAKALADLDLMLGHGTTTAEVKSGYGLDRTTELRLLDVIGSLTHPIDIVPTYVAAHIPAFPEEYSRAAYVALACDVLHDALGRAEYCDVCCDPISFTREECSQIARQALALGFKLRLHADQTGWAGGAELAAELGAASADHLDCVSAAGIRALADAGTVGVLVPAVNFHLMELTPGAYDEHAPPPAKQQVPYLVHRMIEQGVRLAISTDYNPGTAPTLSMQMAMQMAARFYRVNYATVWHMATINAAHALDRAADRGSLEIGKRADVAIWSVPEHGMVIQRFGTNLIDTVVKNGVVVAKQGRALAMGAA